MNDFAQNMAAISAVFLAATSTIKAVTVCIKALRRSENTNTQPQRESLWRRLGWDGVSMIARMLLLVCGLVVGLYEMRQFSYIKTPLTTGDAANLIMFTFIIVLGFYPPVSLDPKPPARTPAP